MPDPVLTTLVWTDVWIPGVGKLESTTLRSLSDSEKALRVSNLASASGDCDISRLEDIIPHNVRQKILSLAARNRETGADRTVWKLVADGGFSNASAYESLLDQSLRDTNGLFKKIWRWPGPERYRFFMWKVAKEALVTN